MYRIYEDEGQWVLWDRLTDEKWIFSTEAEAIQMSTIAKQKVKRGQTVQSWATMLAGLDDWLATLNAKGFDHSAENEPSDEDLVSLGITRDDFRLGVTLLKKLASVITGGAVSELDHTDVLSKLRTDAE